MIADSVIRRDRNYLLESWLELNDAVRGNPDLRRLLFDPVTGLPTTPLVFPRIDALLHDRGEVSLLCLNVVRYSKIEEVFGWKTFDTVMRHVAEALESFVGSFLRDADIVAELMISGNSFVVVLSPPRATLHMDRTELEALAERTQQRVRADLAKRLDKTLFNKFNCYVGSATVKYDPDVRLERLVYHGLEQALDDTDCREAVDSGKRRVQLETIISEEQVRTVVLPVVKLDDMSVVGYEALSRGPADGEFERPDRLFRVAYDSDLVVKLERLCRRSAVSAAREMPAGRLLFLNIEPESISDPELRDIMFTSLLADSSIDPSRIVLEITERTAIVDFAAFRSTLHYLRTLGFAIAVDDAGAGYGSLQCLAEVHPEWLKVDISLVRGIDTDDIRRHLMHALTEFARRIDVNLVAEGVETTAELAVLRELGVPFAQGFLFGQPSAPFPEDPDPISFG
jgi:EAL domain-containing protein (putative c-di-GMP-specific phosphodiesterase class I)/GGDEF domain-containing protein